MTWWQRLWRRTKMEEQLEKELRFHLDQHVSELIARGHSPNQARRQARLVIGGPEQVKENCRDARGTRWLGGFATGLPLCNSHPAQATGVCGCRPVDTRSR